MQEGLRLLWLAACCHPLADVDLGIGIREAKQLYHKDQHIHPSHCMISAVGREAIEHRESSHSNMKWIPASALQLVLSI